ncbi:hypothetical protein MAE02_68440 [Microvirga aerophila]|uniref:Uncharacterized protein n=1 Tax=Microvirga aerophila TaxID=670291 RepID=A0A512C4N5_9HYPH|nr:hypothetical protein MAE02_68440 [Microvirga aerophila]
MDQAVATRVHGMQMVRHLSYAAQITFLSVAGLGVVTSVLSLII